jgi:hypothetical protein
MNSYIFYRGKHWYVVEYMSDEQAIHGAKLNSGTTKIERIDATGPVVIWTLESEIRVLV